LLPPLLLSLSILPLPLLKSFFLLAPLLFLALKL
jgi:hypothetical protein